MINTMRIRRILRERDWSDAEFARRLGVNSRTIYNWLTLGKDMYVSSFARIREALGVDVSEITNPSSWMVGEERAQYNAGRHIPIIGLVSAGGVDQLEWTDGDTPPGAGSFGSLSMALADDEAFALEVRGDSMEPYLSDGDRVVVSPAMDSSPGRGRLHFLRLADGRALLKRARWQPDIRHFVLESVNPGYEPIVVAERDVQKLFRIAFIVPK